MNHKAANRPPTLKGIDLRRHMRWVRRRMGLVFDAKSGLGSGIFLELPDGKLALLTAKHVVVDTILTGELTLQSCTRLIEPSYPAGALVLDPIADAALIYVPPDRRPEAFVPYTHWAYGARDFPNDVPLVASGAPGQWKSMPNWLNRTIAKLATLHYGTVVDSRVEALAHLTVLHDPTRLPTRLGGMSGGPIMDVNGRLYGIILKEELRFECLTGILGLPIETVWNMLHNKPIFPPLNDYKIRRQFVEFVAQDIRKPPAPDLTFLVEYLRHQSQTQPAHFRGTFAILRRIWCQPAFTQRPFLMHMTHEVPIEPDDIADEATRIGNEVISALGLSNWAIRTNPLYQEPPSTRT